MNNIKIIALDMDGTLLNDDELVSDYTKQVLMRVLKEDIHVILTTGRPLQLCHSYAIELGLPTYIISCNGGEIWTVDEQLLSRKLMQVDTLKRLWKIGHDLGLHMWTVATDEIFHNSRRPEAFSDYEWLKIGFGQLNEVNKTELIRKLEEVPDIEVTNSAPNNIEVNPHGVNKAEALKFICEKIGVTMNEVIAMGDSFNDLLMIEEAGIGIAMGNAQDFIKERADDVTATNNEDGVAKAIEKYIFNKILSD